MRWVVVGGGAAGCAVAARLCERPDDEVVVLEAGPGAVERGHDVGPQVDDPRVRWAGIDLVRRPDDTPVPYAQGRGVGGSSLINGGVIVGPTPPELIGILPRERPWTPGPVGEALLAADADAAEVGLIRRNRQRVTAFEILIGAGYANLTVIPDTEVDTLVFRDGRVVSVRTVGGDDHAADAVVCCAGAIGTPTLLLRSGVATPGVGAGLQDHPAVHIAFDLDPATFDVSVPTISVTAERGTHQILGLNHVDPDLALGVALVGVMQVESRGSVTLPTPGGPPNVAARMLSEPADRRRMVAAARDVIEVVRRPAFRDRVGRMYIDAHGTPLPSLRTADDVERWALTAADLGGYHHVSSSCRRGIVTDSDGWLQGYEGVAIGDASLFESVPVRDPYIAVVGQALRLVTPRFRDRHR